MLERLAGKPLVSYVRIQKLRELQAHLAAMRTSCDVAETQLTMTNESSKILLERAGSLRDERSVHGYPGFAMLTFFIGKK